MKRLFMSLAFACVCTLGAAAQTPAPTPTPTTPGSVSRVIYYNVLPGKAQELTTFIRTHTVPLYEEQKKQKLIMNYGFFTKPYSDGPTDWNLGVVITYADYADALDFNADRNAKFDAISLSHYGSVEARQKANDSLNALRTVTQSMLVRGVTFNPMPK